MDSDKKIDLLIEKTTKLKYQIHGSLGFLNGSVWFLIGIVANGRNMALFIAAIFFVALGIIQGLACSARLGVGYFFGDQDKSFSKK